MRSYCLLLYHLNYQFIRSTTDPPFLNGHNVKDDVGSMMSTYITLTHKQDHARRISTHQQIYFHLNANMEATMFASSSIRAMLILLYF